MPEYFPGTTMINTEPPYTPPAGGTATTAGKPTEKDHMLSVAANTAEYKVKNGFIPTYCETVQQIPGGVKTILEIDEISEGSAKMWASYFTDATVFCVTDKDPPADFEKLNIKVVKGNILDAKVQDELFSVSKTFDLIICNTYSAGVDGIKLFDVLWPNVKEGGVYCIELRDVSKKGDTKVPFTEERSLVEEITARGFCSDTDSTVIREFYFSSGMQTYSKLTTIQKGLI